MNDELAMRRALDLGDSARGLTSPNPAVGAVVLAATGEVVGEGATEPVGGRHAEVVALEAAGERARGGTVVVTLEPCNHTGRTGPCVDAVLAAGVARVVYAVADPHEAAAGGGQRLRAAGVEVESGIGADLAERQLEAWLAAVQLGRPHVTWKLAASLDGRVTAADGSSTWITGPEAREDAHRTLRRTCDAIVVGVGTAIADDPALTTRVEGVRHQPLRVVVDRSGRLPVAARVLDDAAETLVSSAPPAQLLALLQDRGVRSVLLEGGPTLAGAFADAGLIDRVVAYVAPALLGGSGLPALLGVGASTIADIRRLVYDDVTQVGEDLRISARVLREG